MHKSNTVGESEKKPLGPKRHRYVYTGSRSQTLTRKTSQSQTLTRTGSQSQIATRTRSQSNSHAQYCILPFTGSPYCLLSHCCQSDGLSHAPIQALVPRGCRSPLAPGRHQSQWVGGWVGRLEVREAEQALPAHSVAGGCPHILL